MMNRQYLFVGALNDLSMLHSDSKKQFPSEPNSEFLFQYKDSRGTSYYGSGVNVLFLLVEFSL